ncbi:MAG TPA: hypothetical protein VHZ03_01725 [Trebonia sp.]|nr:hypothetical protein [Trebonia sp.]
MRTSAVAADVVREQQAGVTEADEHRGDHGAIRRDGFLDGLYLGPVVGPRELRDLPQAGRGQVAKAHHRAAGTRHEPYHPKVEKQ